ncbi:DEAD/DEAH box helicase [Vagococcus fluvialis]|uniref:DEAD/DEAH box helicase n=1 Tax=Vagococcus fluvialis TaxID=2738 RepID=UPI003B5B6F0C
MTAAYSLLKREIKEYIYDQKWQSLTKIQAASIKQAVMTENNLILSAPTASGKTEAAFLPAINAISNFNSGVKIIYISPLIALINDQFDRISRLCEYLNVNVTKWHGEASSTQKKKILRNPNGILLITPESIEAMLTLRSAEAQQLFSGVEWILVDEIHGFLDTNRGLHLKSLLERCQKYMIKEPRYIGMSATLNKEDSQLAKDFFTNDRVTSILLDRSQNELFVTTEYFCQNDQGKSDQSVEAIYQYSQQECMLVFPNSRKTVEYLAVSLNKKAQKDKMNINYFAHHSSLTKNLRTEVEKFAKDSKGNLFTICCTSTLEMGIDIGSVDSIVQYNSPYSVASLGQRLGRSGRKTKKSILHFIATNPFELLKGLATIDLYEEGEIDKLSITSKPYDIFAHQILALLLEKSGVKQRVVYNLPQSFKNWQWVQRNDMETIISHLLEKNYIEAVGDEFITGIETEPLLRKARFFSQFDTPTNYSVISEMKKIGEIPFDIFLNVDSNILLGAKVWKIYEINHENKKIIVGPTNDGKPPKFLSADGVTSHLIGQKMLELVQDEHWMNGKDTVIQEVLKQLKSEQIIPSDPFFIYQGERIAFRTYAGTKINLTLQVILSMMAVDEKITCIDHEMLLFFEMDVQSFQKILIKASRLDWDESMLEIYFEKNPTFIYQHMATVKYQELLPFDIQIKYVIANKLDLSQTLIYLKVLVHRGIQTLDSQKKKLD